MRSGLCWCGFYVCGLAVYRSPPSPSYAHWCGGWAFEQQGFGGETGETKEQHTAPDMKRGFRNNPPPWSSLCRKLRNRA